MSYTKQNFWCSAPATMTSAAQFGSYFNFSATASYRARYIQLPKLSQKTSYSFSFDVTVAGISTYQNQVLMMDPETGTQIVNITGGKFGAYSTNSGDLTAETSKALSTGIHTVTVSISSDPLLLITITTSGSTPTTFEAVRSTNATVINEFLAAMQHCPIFGVPYDLTNYTYFWRGYVIIKNMVITSGAETIFSAYETFTGDMKVADYTASGTPQISGATLNMLSSGVPQFKNVFASDMDSFEIITKMTFFKSITYPTQAYRGGLFYLWQTPASGNYPRLYSNFNLYPTGSTYTDYFVIGYGIASDAGGFATASSQLSPSTDLVFGQPTWYKVVVQNNVGGSRVVIQMYRSIDKTNWTKIADRSVGNLGSNTYRFIFGDNWILSFGGFSNTANGASGLMDLSETYVTSKDRVIWRAFEPSTGSVEIDKGYYNTGSGEIWMPKSKYFLDTLASSETLSWKNSLYAVTKQGAASARMSSGALEGDYQAYKDLEHPVYMTYTMDKILGDTPIQSLGLNVTNDSTKRSYNVVGTPTVDSNGIASNFAETSYLTTADYTSAATVLDSFDIVTAFTGTTASAGYEGLLDDTLNNSTISWRFTRTSANKVAFRVSLTGAKTYGVSLTSTTTMAVGTKYYVKASYSSTSGYSLSVSTNGTTWTTEATNSTTTRPYVANGTIRIGDSYSVNPDLYLQGTIDLTATYIAINGEVQWRPYVITTAGLHTSQTGFLVDPESPHVTYNFPSLVNINLSSFQDVQGQCGVFAVNRTGQNTAGIVVTGESAPSDVATYYKIGEVFVSQGTIPGEIEDTDEDQGIPDIELYLTGPLATHYTVTGSPTVSNYVVSGFSDSNYLVTDLTLAPADPWEVSLQLTPFPNLNWQKLTGGSQDFKMGHSFGIGSNNKFQLEATTNGSSWNVVLSDTADAVPNREYYIKYGWTGTQYYLDRSLDGVTYTRVASVNNSSPLVATIPLQIGHTFLSGHNWLGSVNMKSFVVTVNGSVYWRAVYPSSYTTVAVDDKKYWSYYGSPDLEGAVNKGITVNLLGKTASFSSLSPTATTVYLVGYYDDLTQSIACTADDYTTDEYYLEQFIDYKNRYLGYALTFTDNTYTTVSSFEKVGTRCRLYKGSYAESQYFNFAYYLAITDDTYEAGVPVATVIPLVESQSHSSQFWHTWTCYPINFDKSATVISGTPTTSGEAQYDSSTDTFTVKLTHGVQDYTLSFDYIGDYMVNLPEPLNELPPPDNTDV